MQLKVYIDVFGRLAFCEKFEDREEFAGFNKMLADLAACEAGYKWDLHIYPPGFYMASLCVDGGTYYNYITDSHDVWFGIDKLTPIREIITPS